MDGCEVCQIQARAEGGEDPWAVARLSTGHVGLNPNQHYRGYTFFSARQCVPELHVLSIDERTSFLHDMAVVSHAVFRAFAPVKLNYELLGNTVPHLHWHLVPRHADDPRPFAPIWENLDFLRSSWTGHQETDGELRGQRAGCDLRER